MKKPTCRDGSNSLTLSGADLMLSPRCMAIVKKEHIRLSRPSDP